MTPRLRRVTFPNAGPPVRSASAAELPVVDLDTREGRESRSPLIEECVDRLPVPGLDSQRKADQCGVVQSPQRTMDDQLLAQLCRETPPWQRPAPRCGLPTAVRVGDDQELRL